MIKKKIVGQRGTGVKEGAVSDSPGELNVPTDSATNFSTSTPSNCVVCVIFITQPVVIS